MPDEYKEYFSARSNVNAVLELGRITTELVNLLFNEDQKDLRVFLFLDDDKQREIATGLGLPTDKSFENHLNETIQGLPTSGETIDALKNMFLATGLWRAKRDLLAPPPALPLLLLFSNAARAMGEGDDVAAHNYYRRLQERLKVTDSQKTLLEQKYRGWSEELWGSYRDWLEAWQGEIGLCTVVFPNPSDAGDSDGNPNRKYVQMSISQAILRTHDRENLAKMFQVFNLDSTVPLPEQIMRAMIEEWQTRGQCSPRLRKMWKKRETHQPIIVGALAHLAQWNPTEVDVSKDWVTLNLSAQRNARTGEVLINLDVLTKQPRRNPQFEVLNSEESWSELPIFEVEARRFRVSGQRSLSVQSKLEEIIEGRFTHSTGTAIGTRRPRAIVPLLLQPATREYTESSTVLLNQPQALLIRTDKIPDIVDKVSRLLEEAALPGWKLLAEHERRNIPANWEVVDNVQLIRAPSAESLKAHVALSIFDVVSTTFVDTQSGLRLPGRSPRWIVDNPPTVVGAFPNEDIVELSLVGSVLGDNSSQLLTAAVHNGVAFLDLPSARLDVGVYDIRTRDAAGKTQAHGHVQLVNSSTPDVFASANPKPLGSQIGLSAIKGFLTAEPVFEVQGNPHLKGLAASRVDANSFLQSLEVPNRLPERQKAPAASVEVELRLAKREVPACLAGGAHHWLIEKQDAGKQKEFYVGQCKHCNFIQGFRRRTAKKGQEKLPGEKGLIVSVHPKQPDTKTPENSILLPQSTSASPGENWNLAFEALCYLQQGTYKDLLFVCAQVSPGALAATEFWKNLALLGHIEIEFDNIQRPTRWYIPQPTLNIIDDARAVVSGRRTAVLKSELDQLLRDTDYELDTIPSNGFIDIWQISPRSASPDASRKPLASVDFTSILDLQVETDLARRIIGSLAPMSAVTAGLDKLKMFGTDRKWWDHRSRTWVSTSDSSKIGAYQTLSFTTAYFFNTSELRLDDHSHMASYDLVKHLSAHAANEPLCSYDAASRTFSVPLGADLPRLYGRAVCACSGRLPWKPEGVRELRYVDVPQVVAEHLCWLLSS